MTQVTSPLAKAIRTTEGVLVIASDVVLAVCSAVDPATLPPKVVAVVVGVQHVALLAQRAVIKAKAIEANPIVANLLESSTPTTKVEQFIEDVLNNPAQIESDVPAES